MPNMNELLNEIQALAISLAVWRGPTQHLASLLSKSLNADVATITRHLHSKPLQTALMTRDVILWRGSDGLLRLVDAQPVTTQAAAQRVAHHPGQKGCRYCLLSEANPQNELTAEIDNRGLLVPGSFVHPQCATHWSRLRNQVERSKA